MSETQIEMLEQKIVDLMGEFKIPGLSIGIVKEGKPFYAKGFGARNLKSNLPFTENTLFGIGSISKSFTALAIMQLVEQGKVNLQDPVNKYLNFKLGDDKNPIKICHLLSHSSGFPELDGNVVALVRQLGFYNTVIPMSSWNDFLIHLNSATEEKFDIPNKYFFYNNDMFTCAGLIIEKLTGTKFETYIKDNLLEPLEMNRSTYLKEDFEKDDDILTGYLPSDEKEPFKVTTHPFNKIVYAPGGLVSSAREMQNYIITLINGGFFGNSKIIQQSSLEQIWTPFIKIPEETGGRVGDAWYGFGWVIENDFFGHKLLHHGGDVGSSTAFLALIPDEKMGIIIGANSNASVILGPIARAFLGILLGKDPSKAAPLLNIHKKLKSLTGIYKIYKNLETMEISFEDGILYTTIKDSIDLMPMKLPLVPENLEELKFYVPIAYPNRKIKVQFFIDDKTEKMHLTFERFYFHKN
ncbi:MAG: serine hydrolase domain-containing protein [Promethearchaeota archaeon]